MRKSSATAVSAPLLATSVIVAEFDIDTGACLRACYPPVPTSPSTALLSSIESGAPPGIAGHTEYFANVMLPDGAEKVNVTRTVFVVNRPQPPLYLRFPVYRFARASASTGSSDTQAAWERRPGEETARYVPEILLINATTEEVSLRYKDTEIEAPCAVPMENISSLPNIPADVVRFSKQLEAMLKNEATLDRSYSVSFASGGDTNTMDAGAAATSGAGGRGVGLGGASTAVGGGGGGSSIGDYTFVLVDYTTAAVARQEGYLMKVSNFDRLLKTMTTLLQRKKTAAAAAASGAPRANNSGDASAAAASESIVTPLTEAGSLSTMNSTRKEHPGSSANDTFKTTVHDIRLPFMPDMYGGRHPGLSGEGSPASPEPRLAGGGGGADTQSTTSSMEQSGHLMLPRTDPTSSGDDSDADSVAGGHHVDASSTAAVAAAATEKGGQGASTEASRPVLFGLCAVVSKRDSTARRGGITKSVAVLGPSLVWLEPFFPILVAAAQYCCDVNGTDKSAVRELQRILKRCYDSVTNAAGMVAAGRAKVDQLTAEISKYCTLSSGQQAYVYYNDAPFGNTIKAKIPLSPESNDIVFTRYSLESLIETLGPSSLHLLLGILTEKKILILSRKGEAADVCEAALSLGIIGNMLDRDFMARKVFPYVSVSSVNYFMQVPGYIVGTLNPIFDNVNPWGWDLLCDLDNKSVITAAERLQRKTTGLSSSAGGNWSAATAGLANAVGVGGGNDAEALRNFPAPLQQLYKQLLNTIYHLRALRIGAVERSHRLRLMVEDFVYTVVLVGYVNGASVSVPNALYSTFAHRSLSALRSEMMLTSMMDNIRTHILHRGENPALLLHCVALRHCAWGETPVQRTLQALLDLLNTACDLKLFLRRMPLAVGGLNALVPEGKAAIASMNNFFVMIYESGMTGAGR
ncbi:Stabilization of polarity axis family protein [Leishmania donovani]|uniref:Stabilization of polarity axis family protein n=1 Tax=Leishmania donovani TaxID=5661 RepID=A0A504XAS1_LEIDO|nr:Stabilization of polarity axis family protein [Leishmania donovani]